MTVGVPARVPKEAEATIGAGKVVIVEVTLDEAGKVQQTRLYEATGIPVVDQAAVKAAAASTYSPAYSGCKPVSDTFLVDETIIADGSAPRACETHFRDASVLRAIQPRPSSWNSLIEPATASVEVTIGPWGDVQDARVVRSTGFAPFDDAAVVAAKQSIYAPKIIDCKPVTSTYLFNVTFDKRPK